MGANTNGYDWSDLASSAMMTAKLKDDLRNLAHTLQTAGFNMGEQATYGHQFAGADDATAKVKGAEVVRLMRGIVDRLEESQVLVKGVEAKLKEVVAAIDEDRARRNEKARKLGY